MAGLLLFLLLKLWMIKKELRRVRTEMADKTDESILNVDFVDRNLQDMILEVNRLYGSITDIKRESKSQERAIRDSVSMISHDMRTPLTSVIGYLQMAKRSDDPAEIDENIVECMGGGIHAEQNGETFVMTVELQSGVE